MKTFNHFLYIVFINLLIILYPSVHAQNKGTAQNSILTRAEQLAKKECYTQASLIYKYYLRQHPREKQAWIDYSDNERILGNYNRAMCILNCYKQLFGEDDDYWMVTARIFADAGFYNSALQINHYLWARHLKEPYVIATEAIALYQSNRPSCACSMLNYLIHVDPKSDEIADLDKKIHEPLRSNINVGTVFIDYSESSVPTYLPTKNPYIHQSDSVDIVRIPLIMQLYLRPETSLLFIEQYEHLRADKDSDLTTIDDHTTIEDNEVYIGIEHLLSPRLRVRGLLGELHVTNGHNFFVYDLTAIFFPNQCVVMYLQFLHELFRPADLTNGSPRSVSLGILETGGRVHANVKLGLESSIDIDFRASSLSHHNQYERLSIEPGWVLYNGNIITFELGLALEWLSFKRQLLDVGYYSPHFYQLYEAIGIISINPNSCSVTQLYIGPGVTKDTFTSGLRFAGDVGIQTRYTFRRNLDLVASVDYLYRNLEPSYHEVSAGIGLTWRFC